MAEHGQSGHLGKIPIYRCDAVAWCVTSSPDVDLLAAHWDGAGGRFCVPLDSRLAGAVPAQ